jgi:hypothetical protein
MHNPAEESTTCGRGTPPLVIDAARQRVNLSPGPVLVRL